MTAAFDHVAIGAADLAVGAAWVAARVGAPPPPGGAHPMFATHNRLTATGPDSFLEVIAPDPAATPQRRRWFGLDDPAVRARLASPRPHAVVLRVDDLDAALAAAAAAGVDCGAALTVTRGALRWRFAVRADGAIPLGGAAPLLMAWPPGPHPAARMPDLGLRYRAVAIETPQADAVARLLDALGGPPAPLRVAQAARTRIRVDMTRDGADVML